MLFFKSKKADIGLALSNVKDTTVSRNTFPAMENAPFWACVTKLCRIYATLPIHIYTHNGKNTEIDTQSPLAHVLKNPCPYLNSYAWRFIMHFNFEIHGRAMAIIMRTGAGDPYALYPVSPNCMTPWWNGGHLYWKYNSQQLFSDDDILHFQNTPYSFTGALCPVDYSSADLAVAKSSQTLQKSFFDKATTLGGVLTVPRNTSKEVKEQLAAMFRGEFAGASNGYKTIVLEDTLKYEPIRLSEKDTSKMTEAQNFTLFQVAERFGVPPFFLGDLTKATFANSEQQGTELVLYAIQPRAVAIETGYNKLLNNDQYIKYSLQGLMRGDHTARAAFYHNAIMDGWMSVNEVRQLEDLNPVPDGDNHFFPMNYTTLDKVGIIQTPSYNQEAKTENKVALTEKKIQERKFCEATQNVSKSYRSKIETVIRKQLKNEIDLINNLVKEGASFTTLSDSFKSEIQKLIPEFRTELEPLFNGVMTRLIPIVKKQCGTDKEIEIEDCTRYAASYAKDVAERHCKLRTKALTQTCNETSTDSFETDVDELTQEWVSTIPSEESHEESNRAGNCFDVFLFGQLGVQYMHVVASVDACEFCSKLDGKVVSVNGTVLTKGDSVEDGQGNVRVINKNYKNPPFHGHCSCGVAPGR